MTISASELAAIRDEARQMAESRMLDRCLVEVQDKTVTPAMDPETGEADWPWVQIYPDPDVPPADPDDPWGPCRYRTPTANVAVMDGASSMPALSLAMQTQLSVPISAPVLPAGARVTCMASDDPLLVGEVRRVRAEHSGSQLSAHRYQLEDVQ